MPSPTPSQEMFDSHRREHRDRAAVIEAVCSSVTVRAPVEVTHKKPPLRRTTKGRFSCRNLAGVFPKRPTRSRVLGGIDHQRFMSVAHLKIPMVPPKPFAKSRKRITADKVPDHSVNHLESCWNAFTSTAGESRLAAARSGRTRDDALRRRLRWSRDPPVTAPQ